MGSDVEEDSDAFGQWLCVEYSSSKPAKSGSATRCSRAARSEGSRELAILVARRRTRDGLDISEAVLIAMQRT